VRGQYETGGQFRARIAAYLREGRDRLAALTGRSPMAFAHPWWQASPDGDRCLMSLGYRLTFSGHGLWRPDQAFAIPRVFVSNETPRPLLPERVAAARTRSPRMARVRDLGRRVLWA
jgi:peptidoglycan/xylan/chitin deacetylase (PgdA/CDA1 family)